MYLAHLTVPGTNEVFANVWLLKGVSIIGLLPDFDVKITSTDGQIVLIGEVREKQLVHIKQSIMTRSKQVWMAMICRWDLDNLACVNVTKIVLSCVPRICDVYDGTPGMNLLDMTGKYEEWTIYISKHGIRMNAFRVADRRLIMKDREEYEEIFRNFDIKKLSALIKSKR